MFFLHFLSPVDFEHSTKRWTDLRMAFSVEIWCIVVLKKVEQRVFWPLTLICAVLSFTFWWNAYKLWVVAAVSLPKCPKMNEIGQDLKVAGPTRWGLGCGWSIQMWPTSQKTWRKIERKITIEPTWVDRNHPLQWGHAILIASQGLPTKILRLMVRKSPCGEGPGSYCPHWDVTPRTRGNKMAIQRLRTETVHCQERSKRLAGFACFWFGMSRKTLFVFDLVYLLEDC